MKFSEASFLSTGLCCRLLASAAPFVRRPVLPLRQCGMQLPSAPTLLLEEFDHSRLVFQVLGPNAVHPNHANFDALTCRLQIDTFHLRSTIHLLAHPESAQKHAYILCPETRERGASAGSVLRPKTEIARDCGKHKEEECENADDWFI